MPLSIKDLKRILTALLDPNTKPHQYRVKPAGYCLKCHTVTFCEIDASQEGTYLKCLSCRAESSTKSLSSLPHDDVVLTNGMVPATHQEAVNELLSRKRQLRLFKQELADRIKELITEQNKLQLEIKELNQSVITLSQLQKVEIS